MSVDVPLSRSESTGDTAPRWRRIVAVLALMALAPWAAECSWGGNTLDRFLLVVVFLGPMYGGAAVLIRETARHLGAGWPTIVLLAGAFGMVQAGLVDQSLFDRSFLADTEFAEIGAGAAATVVPVLGFSVEQAFDFIGGHIALSICAPIALVESFLSPPRREQPWLGRAGLAVVAVVYVLGSLLIFSELLAENAFLVSPTQLVFALVVVFALIGAALAVRARHGTGPVPAKAPNPMWGAAVMFAAYFAAGWVQGWTGVAIRAVIAVVILVMIVCWSRRTGWGQRHVLALLSGWLVAAAAGSFVVPNYEPASPTAALVGDISVALVTSVLVAGAFWRLRPAR